MTRQARANPYHVEEHSGDKYASRQLAQRAAQAQLAADLAAIIRDLVAAGELEVIAGKVDARSAPEAKDK